MRPFRIFFGFALGIILFLFVARILFFAFVVAAVMSIIYAIYRRVKEFITYDRNGDYYVPAYNNQYYNRRSMNNNINNEVEPLFYNDHSTRTNPINDIQFVEIR